jgi:hypothetical protein
MDEQTKSKTCDNCGSELADDQVCVEKGLIYKACSFGCLHVLICNPRIITWKQYLEGNY